MKRAVFIAFAIGACVVASAVPAGAISEPIDHPERLDDLFAWLHEAGWMTSLVWKWKDLAVIVAA
jgi:hypothetical protein